MSQTIQSDNLSQVNVKQYGQLDADALSGQPIAIVKDANNYAIGDFVWLGRRGQQQCERLAVSAVNLTTQALTFTTNVEFLHRRGEECVAVYCDQVQFMAAPDVNGQPPAVTTYTALSGGTLSIDPQNSVTTFNDPNGNGAFWYLYLFRNSVSSNITDINEATPLRGYGLDHYVSISDIRTEAGFKNAKFVLDADISLFRQTAEDEVSEVLASVTGLPLPNPLPLGVATITRRLAAGYLMQGEWGPMNENKAVGTSGTEKVTWAQSQLAAIANGKKVLLSPTGADLGGHYAFNFYPDNTAPDPAFTRNQVF